MKAIIFVTVLFLAAGQSFSQRIIEVKYVQDMQGNYQFYGYNNAFCTYILQVNFSSFDNVKSDLALPFRAEIHPGSNKIFKLTPLRAGDPVKFNYAVSYLKGCLQPQPNPDFTYLLPIGPGKEAQAYEMQGPDKPLAGQTDARSWYAVRLKMKPGDTVYAARRGVVSEVDVSSGANDSGAVSIGTENYIEINHADCSFARYGILKRNSNFVKPGQLVEAGAPIGLVGGDIYGRGSEVRFRVYYDQPAATVAQGNAASAGSYWVYLPIQFWIKYKGKIKLTHGADYVSEHPRSIIDLEKPKKPVSKKKPGVKK